MEIALMDCANALATTVVRLAMVHHTHNTLRLQLIIYLFSL